ncbi:hypothetical protein E4U32_001240 [Claviceps aff. humidiphila group G2b]|nr:hypothetical protein E4U32_001240 [Claviceps aff. humidiphila group G2b]
MPPRGILGGLIMMEAWVDALVSRKIRLLFGNGTIGARVAPTRAGDNDKTIGLRLEYAYTLYKDGVQYMRYHLHPNRGANDPTLKALANKDPNAVLSYADIPLAEAAAEGDVDGGKTAADKIIKIKNTDQMCRKFWDDLVKNIKK